MNLNRLTTPARRFEIFGKSAPPSEDLAIASRPLFGDLVARSLAQASQTSAPWAPPWAPLDRQCTRGS